MTPLYHKLSRVCQTAKSAALVLCGVAGMARGQFSGQGCVFTFHGLRQDGEPSGVVDESLHLRVSVFRRFCAFLAARHQVMPLSQMAEMTARGEPLPSSAVAITFDDGYASNHDLAFPILREHGLPATIFLTTGFVDGTEELWFQQVDQALGAARAQELPATLARLKALPDAEMRQEVAELVRQAGPRPVPAPAPMRPLTWEQARAMQAGGLVEFGGHTHSHPILARCTLEHQARELRLCHERMEQELGRAPTLFAYPNGGPADFTADTLRAVREAGFTSAWTMVNNRVRAGCKALEMPRYGSPESLWEAEATASGAFELVRKWRGKGAAP